MWRYGFLVVPQKNPVFHHFMQMADQHPLVISGMLRLNSLVRIGPLSSLHKIVPFQRPSMTDSIESIGQAETSFLETGICLSFSHSN